MKASGSMPSRSSSVGALAAAGDLDQFEILLEGKRNGVRKPSGGVERHGRTLQWPYQRRAGDATVHVR